MNLTDPFVASLQTSLETLRAAINDPSDQIRLLTGLAAYSTPVLLGDTTGGATSALCRRTALASLALACADFQPSSSSEANGVLASVVPLFDAEIQYAADQGDTDTYLQLRTVRGAVISDLQSRGSSLPELLTLNLPGSLPSLVVAWNLYANANREPDILMRNPEVVHPAFIVGSIEVLSS